jgi:serine/threonine protein kinase
MPQFTLEQFQSIVIQALCAIAYGQNKIALKHHDMHLENVFIKNLSEHDTIAQDCFSEDSGFFTYTLDKTSVRVKHCGLVAKLADFGLSSATDIETSERYERADYKLLDAAEAEWGQWSPDLEGQHSYDAVVFLSRFFMEEEKSITSKENIAWAKGLYFAMQEKWPIIECTNIGRPLRGHEGSARIEEMFSLPYLKDFLK